jgi:hypothetical protein
MYSWALLMLGMPRPRSWWGRLSSCPRRDRGETAR